MNEPLLAAVLLLLVAATGVAAAATTALDDSDWRSPAAVVRCAGIEREMTPALLLKTEVKEPVFLFDPTEDETITTITDFHGKLYLGSCTQPADTDTGSVYTYDPETNQWQKVFQVNEQGLVRLEVYGDRLYIAGYDANDGGWDLGNIYVHDGKTWVEHRTVPRAIHEYGLAVYKGRIYVSGDILDPAPPGMTVDEAGDKGLIDVYGRVVSSGDGGLTWREEYRGPQPGQDVGFMTVFRDRLVLNAQGDLLTFDGRRWDKLGLNPDVLVVYEYADAGDLLVLGTSTGLGFFDGKHFWRSVQLDPWQIRGVTRFGSSWVLAGYLFEKVASHGPGGTGYPSADEKQRARFSSRVWVLSDEALRQAARRGGPRTAWFWHAEVLSADEVLTCAHAFAGRLYLGSHPNGRVLVLPVVGEGTLDSAPTTIPAAGTYTLSWEAATPPGTSCRLQVRTAPTREALEKQPFAGPDGTEATSFEAPGATLSIAQPGLVQYRVLLRTENPALTPYLKRVRLQPVLRS